MPQSGTDITTPEDAHRSVIILMVVAIIVLGAALRLYGLADKSIWYDEASTIEMAKVTWPPVRLVHPDYTTDAPGIIILTRAWRGLLGLVSDRTAGGKDYDFLLRLLPCLAGIAGIGLTYLAGRVTARDRRVALAGAFLFAISPFQIFYAQELRAYSWHVVFATSAFIFMALALDTNRLAYWIGWVLCCVAGIYNHFVMVWIIMAFNLYFLVGIRWHWNRLKAWIPANLAIIVLSIPALWLAFFLSSKFEQAGEQWFPRPDLRIALITIKNFFAGYSPNAHVYQPLLVLALVLMAAGAVALRRNRRALALLVVAGFAPIALTVLYWRTTHFAYYTHRLMIFSAVPIYLLVAQGLFITRRRAWAAVALVALVALTMPPLADHYGNCMHPSWDHRIAVRRFIDNRNAAAYIADHAEFGDYIAHNTTFTMNPFRYYHEDTDLANRAVAFSEEGRRGVYKGLPHKAVYDYLGLIPDRLEVSPGSSLGMWIVTSGWEPYEYEPSGPLMVAWLDARMLRLRRQPFDGLTVFHYRLELPPISPAKRVVLADHGDWNLPAYFSIDCSWTSLNGEWVRAFLSSGDAVCDRNASDLVLSFDYARLTTGEEDPALPGTLCTDEASGARLAVSFPTEADGDFDYRFVITNGPDAHRMVQCRILESCEAIDPLAFTAESIEYDVWQPAFQYDAASPAGMSDVPGLVAKLTADSPDGAAAFADVSLGAGDYDVYAWMIEAADPRGMSRAEVHFGIERIRTRPANQAIKTLGATDGSNPEGHTGWNWHRVGAIDWPGGAGRLRIAAHNTAGLAEAYFDLGRILFVPAGQDFQRETFDIELAPGERRVIERRAHMGKRDTLRIDIEVFDPATRRHRRINAYCQRPTPTLTAQ
ncbi:MAG TPA: glycosyltransferase family 39 protein [Candidatus Hydrogenedentes bacterium]|nr:glycosyltransferase family 39 protein [Candidatus Hydrogenedentota bacterium]HPG67515.1 glycosyltransferase family 39 protein [Candidatus Hydrogenedentota bacterium]